MRDTPNGYTEILLDFGLEGLALLKWGYNKARGAGGVLPKELIEFYLARSCNRVRFSIVEGFGIEVTMDLVQNGRDF